ncbi:MAG: L-2-amino-thiazoline-4-carboxylic acid hydrolase [Candidatus Bathyarchaeota archaeon]|nr:L-2-amino-thiazoline-4-carboxylic acid hydrolase [Candidatus Bathyarchaeota archaeon]
MVTQADIDEFGELWSLMYIVFAEEMVDSFGDEGKQALIRAVQAYGKARGLRLRKRHEEEGRPINLRSLFEHYDLPGISGTEKTRTKFTDNQLVSFTYKCPYEQIWRSRGKVELGLVYCQYFHHAFWQSYRPDLDVQLPEILTQEDPHCKFVVTQPED